MSTTLEPPGVPTPPVDSGIRGAAVRPGDRAFKGLSRGSGIFILVTMAAIAAFLVWRAIPSLQANTVSFFTTQVWFPDQTPVVFGIAALTFGTLMTAAIATCSRVPMRAW
jgi:phosphate transport system permease protein